jgi:nucleoid DNA-binding protein
MDDKKVKGGKGRIVNDVMAKGFSARKAAKAVNAVFDLMKFALWCGEPVEVPGGVLQAKVRQGRERREWQRFRNVNTGKIKFAMVSQPGRRRVVKFKPDEKLDLKPLPPPETVEQAAARQVASELLGKPADQAVMAMLQQAVEVNPQKPWERLARQPEPETLRRRLQFIQDRGSSCGSAQELAREVALHYWVW